MFDLGSNVKSLKDCILKLLVSSLFIFVLSNHHLTTYAGNLVNPDKKWEAIGDATYILDSMDAAEAEGFTAGIEEEDETKNEDDGITFTTSGLKSISADPLGNIGEDSTDTTQIKNLGGGAISIIRTFAVLGMVISLITGAITLMVNGYRAKNAVASDVSSKLLVIVVIGGLSFFINVVLTIAKAL